MLSTSVIITSYNYGRFLRQAIDSVLSQSHHVDQLVIVDDGSTDNSREIIAAAAAVSPAIQPILKENGGQASAFNVGFAASSGDVVLFLDADDILEADTVARVVAAFEMQPDAAKVHYRLAAIDADGKPTGELRPPRPLWSGDLREHVLRYYFHPWPPTSGTAFPRWVLKRILPVPENELYRISSDRYLTDMAVLLGPFVSLPGHGALYRRHGDNHHDRLAYMTDGKPDLTRLAKRSRDIIMRARDSRSRQRRLAEELELSMPPANHDRWRRDGLQRLISLKLEPEWHPMEGDTTLSAAWDSLAACLDRGHNPNASFRERALQVLWIAAVFIAPRPYSTSLIWQYYFPAERGRLARLLFKRREHRYRDLKESEREARSTCIIEIRGKRT
jgi:glycosyltransferase involved in cell wall biosynthesis